MLTAWGKKIVAIDKSGVVSASSPIPGVTVSSTTNAMIEAKSIGGTTKYIPPIAASAVYTAITSSFVETGSSSSCGVAFGSDGTAASEANYTLGSHITGITVSAPASVTTYIDTASNEYVARLDYSISNDTGADITIREVGLFVRFNAATTRGSIPSSSASNRTSFMLDRTVLDTPVVIPNGTAGVVRYEFRYQT